MSQSPSSPDVRGRRSGTSEGEEEAGHLPTGASSCPGDMDQRGPGRERQPPLERGVQGVDELALATLGYLVLPIKSPGLKNGTDPLPCPCPWVFYVSSVLSAIKLLWLPKKLVARGPLCVGNAAVLGALGVWMMLKLKVAGLTGLGTWVCREGIIWSLIPSNRL